jgi:hypothetical protein
MATTTITQLFWMAKSLAIELTLLAPMMLISLGSWLNLMLRCSLGYFYFDAVLCDDTADR